MTESIENLAWQYADGELVDLRDFARKGLSLASELVTTETLKLDALSFMETKYRAHAIKSDDAIKALNGMMVAIKAVINGKRSKEQAALYIATEFLECDISDVGRFA